MLTAVMLPFWISIALLSLAQGAVVAVAARAGDPGRLERLRSRRWALIPPASVIGFVLVARARRTCQRRRGSHISRCARCRCSRRSRSAGSPGREPPRPARALLVVPLFALAWADRGGLPGEARRARPLGAQLCRARRAARRRHAPALAGGGDRGDGRRGHGARRLRPAAAAEQRAQRRSPGGGPAAAAERGVRLGGDGLRRPVRRRRARRAARGHAWAAACSCARRGSRRCSRWPSTCCSSSWTSCPATVPVALTLLILLLARRRGRSSSPTRRELRAAATGQAATAVARSARSRSDAGSSGSGSSCAVSGRAAGLDGAAGAASRARRRRRPARCAAPAGRRGGRTSRPPRCRRRHGRVELAADLGERLDEAPEAAVQLARGLRDLARGLGDQLLAPAVVDGPQQADQGRGGGHQHLLLDAVLDQRRVLGERGLVDAVGGHEHHDELGRGVELALVALGGELGDVLARLAWRGARACSSRSLLRRAPRARPGRRRAGPSSRPRSASRRAGARACRAAAVRPRCGSCSARRSRSARPSPPSRPRCAAGSRPRSRAWSGASARRRGCRSPGAACRRPRAAGGPSARARPGPAGARARGARSRSPSCRASPGTGCHEPLDLLGAPGHLARARAPPRRGAASAQPLRQRVAGLREHVHRDRLQLVAHALALLGLVRVRTTASKRPGARGAEQDSDDQQQDAHGILTFPDKELPTR